MDDLDRYLADFFEQYLFKDIDTLRDRATVAPGEKYGACGYPLLLAVFGGIERLGALSSMSAFSSERGKPAEYFCDYWANHLYPAFKEAGEGFYYLARHGLAHSFIVKGQVEVSKGEPARHLTKTGDKVTIDSLQLAVDFRASYPAWKSKHLVQPRRSEVEKRLKEILDDNDKKVAAHWRFFVNLKDISGAPAAPTAQVEPTESFRASNAGATQAQVPPAPASSNPFNRS